MPASNTDEEQPSAEAKAARDITDPTMKALPSPEGIRLEEIPERYEDGRMVLLARDPTWLYVYWDLTAEQNRKVWKESNVVLRIVELREGQIHREVKQIWLTHGARSGYFQIDLTHRVYQAELGFIDAQGKFQCVVASNPSTMPPSAMEENEEFVFATFKPEQPPRPTPTPPEAQQVDKDRVIQLAAGHPESAPSSAEFQKGAHSEQQAGNFFSGVSSSDASKPPKK
jgi:hypothetical protein